MRPEPGQDSGKGRRRSAEGTWGETKLVVAQQIGSCRGEEEADQGPDERQYGPPEGSEAATSKAYREAVMRGPIMARIGELQRDRHHVFHGEGDSHDPISFGEEGDEAPVAGVEPEEAHEARGGREEPELQTQAGVEPRIFGHTPEDPRVGTKRVMSLREWVLAQVAKGAVRTGDLFRLAVASGFPRDAMRLMTTHLVSGEKVVWATHPPVNDN
ncbi:hypothetical protein CYMTET_16910 [Cymbomonas tetramitiformis]|uniref:Uncharacterized protein n=1 Tax=Cymbomonas tetramitiformis TaxID=36881 RepID=A0AAE0L7S9_9CHLO|nr:hypothetical protein CYMTET_16910 [Cymbomonas tetramitiformis]